MWISITAGVVALGVGFFGFKSHQSRSMDIPLGVDAAGQFVPCPDKPNCVNSEASDTEHKIDPLPLRGSSEESLRKIRTIIGESPRAEIVTDNGTYIHATYTSFLFRYIDDVQFFSDAKANVIQVKSASRVGHSDLGVNRKRVEEIRRLYER